METKIRDLIGSENELFDLMSFLDLPEIGVALYEIMGGREFYSKDLELDLDREDALAYGFERFGVQNKLRFCNQYFAHLSGYSKDHLMGQHNLFSLLHPDMTKEDLRIYQQNIQNGLPWYGVFSWKRPDANRIRFINKAIPMGDKLYILALHYPLERKEQ